MPPLPPPLRVALLVLGLTLGLLAPSAASARVPRTFVGVLPSDVSSYGPTGLRTELASMERLGAGQMRQTLNASAPATSVAGIDALVLEAARHRIRILPQLLDDAHYHAADDARHGLRPPRRFHRLARFAARMARRYGRHGLFWRLHPAYRRYAVTTWQIWNEPNLPVWWRPHPSPRRYARMVHVVGRAIHRVNHHAVVLSAGIPDSRQSKPRNYRRYLAAFLRAGGWRWIDGVGAHVYVRSIRDVKRVLRTYRRTLNRHHGRRLKILISEIGWASAGHRNPMVVGPRGQARRIRRGFRLIGRLRHRYRIFGVFYYQWSDNRLRLGDPRGNTWGYHTGLVRVGGGHKPAYSAFRHAVARLRR